MTGGALKFWKMHGLGNDFVVLDGRDPNNPIDLSPSQVRAIADRQTGMGCDQLITLQPSSRADVFMRIQNADGGEVSACGNAARCVGWLVARDTGRNANTIETRAGILTAIDHMSDRVTVDMGAPGLGWRDIPLAREMDTLHLPMQAGALRDPVGTSMGNPHATFFVADVESLPLAELGQGLEHDPLFPERANIGVAQVKDTHTIRLRVWERGAGITRACGTGACAAVVAAVRRGLTGRRVNVLVDGSFPDHGNLDIEWRDSDNHVYMTGPVATVATGTLDPSLLASVPAQAVA